MTYLENLNAIRPELALTVFALVLMTWDALRPRSRAVPWLGFVGLLV